MAQSPANGLQHSRDLAILNLNRDTLPGPRLLHELIASAPEQEFLLDFLTSAGDRIQITYQEFHRLTDLLAQDIRNNLHSGLNQRSIIPVVIPQCPELYVAWVAVLKAGAGFCPVAQDVPPERLKFIVQDVEASFVLTTSKVLDYVRHTVSDVMCMSISLENLRGRLGSCTTTSSTTRPQSYTNLDGPAYVMYTSGSTGLPKGVVVSHFSVTQSLLAHDEHIPHFKRFLQFASPTFDVSIFEVFFPFFRGATLVACEREHMLSDLPATIRCLEADAAELTPTVAGTLLRTREAAPCLRTLLTIGEMLTSKVVSAFGGDSERPSMLYAMYGPTEAAIHCTLAAKLASSAPVRSIGRPLRTVTAFILKDTDHLDIASVGEAGELAIAGQLADGYLNRPDQNKQAFVELPGYGPVYKTGDRAICLEDGGLEILGRMSSGQVKIRGQRVELGEIEEVALKTQGAQLAVASVIEDVLVLFCAAQQEVKAADVSATCKSWLPPYMRPGKVLIKGDLPRLPSGKVDRKTLEFEFRQSMKTALITQEFEDRLERDIAEILEQEMGQNIARSTSFWSLGLDSLRAIKVASRLRQTYTQLNAGMLAEVDNVAELAAIIKSQEIGPTSQDLEPPYEESQEWKDIEKTLRGSARDLKLNSSWEKLLPCSSMQLAMLVETAAAEELNFNQIWLSLSSEIRFEEVFEAFKVLARRNEILRSGFIPTGHRDMPFAQIVWKDLTDRDLTLLHPLQLVRHADDESQVLVRIHHALYDGWSWDLMIEDLNRVLDSEALPSRAQFSQLISHERSQSLASEVATHWNDLFQDFVPSDFPNLAASTSQSSQRTSVTLPLSISYSQLSATAMALRCGREAILESAWAFLLSSYVDNPDVAIGVVSAGRHLPILGIESMIGPCLSTFPVRLNTNAVRTVQDAINHIQQQRSHHQVHGAPALRDINLAARVSPGSRLFDTLFVWQQNYEGGDARGLKVRTTKTQDVLAYAAVLELEPRNEAVYLKISFNTAQIPEAHAKLLAGQLGEITNRMIQTPGLELRRLWASCEPRLMSVANSEYGRFESSFDLVTTIKDVAKNDPDRLAVEFVRKFDSEAGQMEKETLTYHELLMQASVVASTLRSSYDVQPDNIVCVIAPRSLDLYVAILGVVMAGAGYMCIDPQTPRERIKQILDISRSRFMLFGDGFDPDTIDNFPLLEIRAILRQPVHPGGGVVANATGDHLAYAVFTSGSTGVPKGVLITRKNLLSNLESLSRIYPCVPGKDRLLQSCSPTFDVSVFEIFWTWHVGMTLCTASNDVLFRDLAQFIDTLSVTHLSMTPSVAALVHPDSVPKVKMLVTAGEPMNSKVFGDWADRGLYQGYGPSETTNICNVRPKVSSSIVSNNVGPALPNTSVFICQRQASTPTSIPSGTDNEVYPTFVTVPRGAVGEIWIGGEQVGRGYVDPELTVNSFLEHPTYGRLYRSGDIGRLLADNSLNILGREDDQVKLRGHRIELGDINSSLLRNHEVRDALSMIITKEGENAKLVTFWTPRKPTIANKVPQMTRSLFEQLTSALPGYMVPDVLLCLDDIPLTRQGKVDRKAMVHKYSELSSEQLQQVYRDSAGAEDTNDLSESELCVAEALSESLRVPLASIRRNTSFYGLGLDSISAIKVAHSIRAHFPAVEISTILRNPSVGQLMAKLVVGDENNPRMRTRKDLAQLFDKRMKSRIVDIYSKEGLDVEKILPCTPLQESMAIGSLAPSYNAYHNLLRFQVHGDFARLKDAWTQAQIRHETLRTGFIALDSAENPFAQVVLKNFPLPWRDEDGQLPHSHESEPLRCPPWSLQVRQIKGYGCELVLMIHHCLYDAEAMSILLGEVQAIYHGMELPHSIPFDRYLGYMESSKSDTTDQFWHDKLQRTSPCKMGDLVKGEDKVETGGGTCTASRTATLGLRESQACVRCLSSTSLALFQATWTRLLMCMFQRQDILFGNVLSGRNLPVEGVDRIVAPCFNTIPMRVQLKPGETNSELIRNLQQRNIAMLPYQPSSLRRIQRQNAPNGGALFDALLLLQQEDLQLDRQIWSLVEESGDMSFPFILEIVMHADTDAICLKLHSEIAGEHFLRKVLASFDALLSHTANYPQSRALDFSTATKELPETNPVDNTIYEATASATTQVNGYHDVDEQLSNVESLIVDIMMQLRPKASVRIYRDTTIFQLGLDSINAVQIAARLRKKGYNISGADILEAASIDQIAEVCESNSQKPEPTVAFDLEAFDHRYRTSLCSANAIDEATIEAVRPCTPTQSGILSQFLRSDRRMYFNSMQFAIENGVDIAKLKEAWATVQKMHEMLRTGFVETDDPQIPFVMVTYRPDAVWLPWNSVHLPARSPTPGASQDKLDLSKPPWGVAVSSAKNTTTLELSMLHALYDAHSLETMMQDVDTLLRDEEPSPSIAPSRAISKILAMSRNEESRKFWNELASDLCPTRFPDMRVHFNDSEEYRVTARRCSLPRRELEKACADAGVSIQAVCATVWSHILSAYTAQGHVTFGIILSGRNFEREEENEVAFPCINTVPFAIEVSQDPKALLQRVSTRCAGLMRHQHTPLSSIKRWTGIEGDLFDSVIVVQKYGSASGIKSPWKLVKDESFAEYAVSLEIIPTEQEVDLQLTFRENVLPTEQAGYILQEVDALMRDVLASAVGNETELSKSLLSIVPWKDEHIETDVHYLHEFVEVTAKQTPDRVALEFVTSIQETVCEKQDWTYSQLDAMGNKIADMLQKNGVQVGELVAVCFDKCPEASFAILGIQKAGCGYLAMDPGAPKARKEFILRDAGCKNVLTTKNKAEDFPTAQDVTIIPVDVDDWQSLSSEKPTLSRELVPQDTCYCLYTSGTTGTPKGCLISHESAVQAMLAFQRIFKGRWNDSSRWLQFASFHFDVSVLEQYWSWSVGICVTSAPRDLLFEDLPGTIRALKITHLDLTPSLARLLTPDDVPSLCQGVFIVGGEQVTRDILVTWGDAGCLYNFYGPSEVTIGCTVHRNVPKGAKPTNIGQQWDNVGSFVLEPKSHKPVLRGAVGELCLSGPLVGKGYLNRPELTAEKFVTLGDFKTRIYRTGDLVRLLHDNSFEFLGRIDDQVKLRGQRLEIGEINHVAKSADPDIKDVTTIIVKHPVQQREQLVTIFSIGQRRSKNDKPGIVNSDEATALAERIQKRCSDRLPAYMVPTHFMAVSFLPLSVNNKTDNKALRVLYEDSLSQVDHASSAEEDRTTPEDPNLLSEVVEILAGFMQIPASRIRQNSTLFELGLDSVAAIGLSRAFKRKGFQNTDVATILRHPIVGDLARTINQKSVTDQKKAVSASMKRIETFAQTHRATICQELHVRVEDIEFIAPCTPLQEGMISKSMQTDLDDTTYFTSMRFELEPEFALSRLRQAWRSAVQSFSILRTYFVSTTDGFAQVVLRASPNNRTLEYGDSSFEQWVACTKSFSTSLPWKVELGERRQMVLHIFHGLYDGISLPLLLDHVKMLYYHPNEKPKIAKQFYEALPYGPLCAMADEEKFWSSRLSSLKPFRLPQARPESSTLQQPIVVDENLSQAEADIQELSRMLNVTPPAIFQASWLYTLEKMFKATPSMGVVLSGRSTANGSFEDVIGPMFNTIPFAVTDLPRGSTLANLVRACHQFSMDVIPYQHTPLRTISRYLGHDSKSALLDNLFVFQKSRVDDPENDPWLEISSDSTPDYPLNVEVEQKGSTFTITIVTKPEYLDETEARQLLITFVGAVQSLKMERLPLSDSFWPLEPKAVVNGIHEKGQESQEPFVEAEDRQWTKTELAVRDQIAEMAFVDKSSIQLSRPSVFELGLDSIEAMKLAARLRNVGFQVSVSSIMKHPTVAGIAKQIQLGAQAHTDAPSDKAFQISVAEQQDEYRHVLRAQGIDLSNVETIMPVMPMQEGLLAESTKYLNVLAFKVRSRIDVKRLAAAWDKASQEQPILRTRFAVDERVGNEAAFLQYVLKQGTSVEVIKDKELSEAIRTLTEDAATQDVSGQCFRVRIFVNSESEAFLLLAMPHAMYDAWSLHLLHREVADTYHSPKSDRRPPPFLLRHVEEALSRSRSQESTNFWHSQLSQMQPSLFRPTLTNQDQAAPSFLLHQTSSVSLPDALIFCKQQGITLQSLALACWTIALVHHIRRLDVCFGVVLSGRTTEDSGRLIFPTFNTVLFRPKIGKGATKAQVLRRVHDVSVQISEHQHFPLRKAVQYARQQGAGAEVFDTLFTFQKLPNGGNERQDLYDAMTQDDAPVNPPYAVNVELEGQAQALSWTIAFQAAMSGKRSGEDLLSELDSILSSFVAGPEQPILEEHGDAVSICGLPEIQISTKIQDNKDMIHDTRDEEQAANEASWSPIEVTIRDVLSKVSNTDIAHIKKASGIFHLGLDSVSAIKFSSLLRKEGIRLPVSEIIKAQTIEKMAAAVQRSKTKAPPSQSAMISTFPGDTISRAMRDAIPIPSDDVEMVMPCTAGQIYMLDMWTASEGRLFYPTFWLEVSGINIETLQNAMKGLTNRMPILRTTFVNHNHDGRVGTWQVVIKEDAVPKYDFPWSFRITASADGLLLTLRIHHALYDAVSFQLLMTGIERLCRDDLSGFQINTRMDQFLDKTCKAQKEAQKFWTTYLSLDHDSYGTLGRGSFASSRVERFNPSVVPVAELTEKIKQHGLSIQALFFAAYARIYSALFGKRRAPGQSSGPPSDVVIGIYLANRSLDIEGLTELVAPTFNIIPVKVKLGSKTLIESAQQVQDDLGEITKAEYCGISMREIYDWTGVKVDTFVNFLSLPGSINDNTGETTGVSDLEGQKGRVKHANTDQRVMSHRTVAEGPSPFLSGQRGSTQASTLKWCSPAIDIEAKVADGYLGVGVFAPEDMLSEDQVEGVMEDMRRLMMDFDEV
ncbi:hypothetical protein LTR47_001270 [Exophiala xenobiotica]|nr:hypothetical protein LTR47_001270 [Exophiala xenobiotica]KAK5248196.1 hypothetical protein LTS06_006730 [Exophiala xenobiotica]KAK5355929.1 hypothetical protein LTR61_001602 [Exophiala xenobiotica]KAK5385176.1 hypothetical protein LTR11_001549 [Exophiala xenobiotica]KAK5386892.1 hypothetical protein LTS03_002166 [Exophiala xenobiotica]